MTVCTKRVQQLETCFKINALLTSELDLANLLDTIMKTLKSVIRVDACSLFLKDDNTGDLVFQVALSPVGRKIKNMHKRIKIGEGIAGMVAKTGKPLMIKDAYKYPGFNPDFDKKTGFKTGSILCSPIKVKGKVIGVCQVINSKKRRKPFSGTDMALFRMFCDHAALAIQNAISHQALMENQRLEKEMQVAKTIQQDFLPLQVPEHDQFLFAAKTIPARIVGGDFYDFIPFDDRTIGIVLGDVSGKGVGAALHMARLMSDFRYVSRTHHDPATLLGKVNNVLFERARRGMFTTVVYAVLDMKKRTMKVANAGHHPILLLNKKKKVVECGQASGAPLGIVPKVAYKQEEIKLHRGDTILIYTDGAVEPKNKKNVPFGLKRVHDLLIKSGNSPEDLIDKLQKSIQRFVAGQPQFDDLTFLSFKVL
ncbi:MAG: GAF domain-containing SpoIIE family protein phosphatase [Nitrospinales bacterium]